ncbi:MAG: hypothetical protein ACHQU1_13360, partial [Gemmatimonadales bacterium]
MQGRRPNQIAYSERVATYALPWFLMLVAIALMTGCATVRPLSRSQLQAYCSIQAQKVSSASDSSWGTIRREARNEGIRLERQSNAVRCSGLVAGR